MRRVVYDANIWISALLRTESVPAQAIDAAQEGFARSVTSEALIDQVCRAMPGVGFTETEVRRAEARIRTLSLVLNPGIRLHVITAKESDNRVLECAVAGEADFIVTGDRKHLLRLGQYEGIPIILPREFVDTFP